MRKHTVALYLSFVQPQCVYKAVSELLTWNPMRKDQLEYSVCIKFLFSLALQFSVKTIFYKVTPISSFLLLTSFNKVMAYTCSTTKLFSPSLQYFFMYLENLYMYYANWENLYATWVIISVNTQDIEKAYSQIIMFGLHFIIPWTFYWCDDVTFFYFLYIEYTQ